jgi:glycosyltransferase involved in cell wall biosynthesis
LISHKDAGHKSKNFAALFTIKQMLSKTHKIDKKSESTNLTIVVLALNEASMITSCLESASFAEQILVIDSGSSDDTLLIARSLGAEVHSYADWEGFAIQRNRALKHCRKDYVFFLDCDEIIPANLAKEILEIVKQGTVNRGLIRWDDFVFGKRLQGIHQTKGVARLFKIHDILEFRGQVHENAVLKAPEITHIFNTKLIHYSRRTVYQSLLKLAQYSQLAAISLRKSKKNIGVLAGLMHAIPRFLKLYFVKMSFLSGAEGFLYSLFIALEVFFKYCAARYDDDSTSSTPVKR